MNAQEEFLKDTEVDPNKVDVLEQPLLPEVPEMGTEGAGSSEEGTEGGGTDDKGELKPRNRRERRLMERLDAEKQSSAFLAGKLEARTEAGRAVSEESDYLKSVERIYGTDTPEAQLATDLLKKAIVGAREDAKQAALEEIRQDRQREMADQNEADKELDSMIDEIEDEYGVTLTEPQERAYFQLLEKMSPKDKNGEVIEYADPHAVWEMFQEKLKQRPTDTRAKDLSSRSMVNSGSSKESNLNADVTARFLKEQGII